MTFHAWAWNLSLKCHHYLTKPLKADSFCIIVTLTFDPQPWLSKGTTVSVNDIHQFLRKGGYNNALYRLQNIHTVEQCFSLRTKSTTDFREGAPLTPDTPEPWVFSHLYIAWNIMQVRNIRVICCYYITEPMWLDMAQPSRESELCSVRKL